ncbi:MAG: hypothetical protein GF347_03455 [Candidatus Moranbacteria bacterium]|nr:hypothetical protein [Candidatus Moranbacteria bacterium]
MRKKTNKKIRSKKNFNFSKWRVNLVFLLFILGFGAIVTKLFDLQIVQHAQMKEKANQQYRFFERLKPARGQIYIKDGENSLIPVATNEEKNTVIIVPKYITDTEGTIQTLATALEMDTGEIRAKVMKEDDPYEIIKKKIDKRASEIIAEKKMDGVQLIPEIWRNYPEKNLASQIIGFVSNRGEIKLGQYGIEEYFNDVLEGESGFVKSEKDTSGRWISISKRIMEKPKNGADIILTLDQTVQYYSQKLLAESVTKYGAESGNIVVVDPQTGKIIAMANYPTYDNNEYNKIEDTKLFKNSCIQDQFEPGSVFKPFTASIAMDLGKVDPTSVYHDKGYYKVDKYEIKNSDLKAYGDVTLTQFLELSLNTGAIWSMEQAGQDNFYRYLKDFGFGRKTGIELSGELGGSIRNLDYNRKVNFATASFGQGISVTPLQLTIAFASLINGGKLYEPQIVERLVFSDGTEQIQDPKLVRQIIKPEISKNMQAMLISVVKNGWGKNSQVPGYLIGGKTGTAQIADPNGDGYSDQTIHSFIGFAPADEPEFVTLVRLNKVSNTEFAADSAAVVNGKLTKYLLDHYQIFPTEEIKEEEVKKFNEVMESLENIKVIDANDEESDKDTQNDEAESIQVE